MYMGSIICVLQSGNVSEVRRVRVRKGGVLLLQEDVAAFHVNMAAMEGVWVSAEHQCAIWCNQLASKIGSMIVDESQQLLNPLQSPVQHRPSQEPHESSSVNLNDGGNVCNSSDLESKRQSAASLAVALTHQRLQRLWKATKVASRPRTPLQQDHFWEGLDPILVSPMPLYNVPAEESADSLTCELLRTQSTMCVFKIAVLKSAVRMLLVRLHLVVLSMTDVCRVHAWRFAGASTSPDQSHTTELTFMFAGKPDTLNIEVLVSDNSGATSTACASMCQCTSCLHDVHRARARTSLGLQSGAFLGSFIRVVLLRLHAGEYSVLDVSAAISGSPLAQRRKQHNPKIAPADVYAGLQYDWHGNYVLSLNPSSFPGLQVQVRTQLEDSGVVPA